MRSEIEEILQAMGDPERAAALSRYFKTRPGQYGEGDTFLGITVPQVRSVAKRFQHLSLSEVVPLLHHKMHEMRLAGLEILGFQFEKGDEKKKKEVVACYLANLQGVNNWDLVDGSAPYILGPFLYAKGNTKLLDTFAASHDLWKQRIAIVATAHFIQQRVFEPTLRIAETLLHHDHDLIHKAVGWMLREVGKKDRKILEGFLKKHASAMPRTMLRYAIEKFEEPVRKKYLQIQKRS